MGRNVAGNQRFISLARKYSALSEKKVCIPRCHLKKFKQYIDQCVMYLSFIDGSRLCISADIMFPLVQVEVPRPLPVRGVAVVVVVVVAELADEAAAVVALSVVPTVE